MSKWDEMETMLVEEHEVFVKRERASGKLWRDIPVFNDWLSKRFNTTWLLKNVIELGDRVKALEVNRD